MRRLGYLLIVFIAPLTSCGPTLTISATAVPARLLLNAPLKSEDWSEIAAFTANVSCLLQLIGGMPGQFSGGMYSPPVPGTKNAAANNTIAVQSANWLSEPERFAAGLDFSFEDHSVYFVLGVSEGAEVTVRGDVIAPVTARIP